MTILTDRIAVVARHSPVTGLGYSRTRCGCGEAFSPPYVKSHAAHVAERVVAELQLTEEWGTPYDTSTQHDMRRWRSSWSAVEENP